MQYWDVSSATLPVRWEARSRQTLGPRRSTRKKAPISVPGYTFSDCYLAIPGSEARTYNVEGIDETAPAYRGIQSPFGIGHTGDDGRVQPKGVSDPI